MQDTTAAAPGHDGLAITLRPGSLVWLRFGRRGTVQGTVERVTRTRYLVAWTARSSGRSYHRWVSQADLRGGEIGLR